MATMDAGRRAAVHRPFILGGFFESRRTLVLPSALRSIGAVPAPFGHFITPSGFGPRREQARSEERPMLYGLASRSRRILRPGLAPTPDWY